MTEWRRGGLVGVRGLSITEGGDKLVLVTSSEVSLKASPGTRGSLLGQGVRTYRDPRRITILMDLRGPSRGISCYL